MIPEEEFLPTMKLGIEALKRVLVYRKGMYLGPCGEKLPGETEK